MPEKIEKGSFFLVASNGFSFIANYLIYLVLGRFLLGPELLGSYAVVISIVSVIEMVLVKSMQQAVSKFVSENPEAKQSIRKKAALLITGLDIACFAAYFACSDFIAYAFGDPTLAPYIKLAALLFLFQPVFSAFSGYLNGVQRFVAQAGLRTFYAFIKLFLVVGLVYIGFGLFGAVGGFVIASFFGLAVSFFMTSKKVAEKAAKFDYRRFLLFMASIVAFSVFSDLMVNIDLFAVKALSGAQSALLSGYYVAASTIARIFPSLVSAIAFAIFPLVSKATFQKNPEKARFYISNTMRYSLLMIIPVALLFASTPRALVSLVYSDEYLPGAEALSILSIAFAVYTVFFVLCTIIAGSNRPKLAALISFAALALSAVLNLLLVPQFLINGAAFATLAGSVFGLVLSAGFVLYYFRALVPWRSLLKMMAASLLIFAVSICWPVSGILLAGKYFALLCLYLLLLLLMREFSKMDFDVVKNIIR